MLSYLSRSPTAIDTTDTNSPYLHTDNTTRYAHRACSYATTYAYKPTIPSIL